MHWYRCTQRAHAYLLRFAATCWTCVAHQSAQPSGLSVLPKVIAESTKTVRSLQKGMQGFHGRYSCQRGELAAGIQQQACRTPLPRARTHVPVHQNGCQLGLAKCTCQPCSFGHLRRAFQHQTPDLDKRYLVSCSDLRCDQNTGSVCQMAKHSSACAQGISSCSHSQTDVAKQHK